MKAQGAPRARRRVSSAAWEPCRGLGSPPRLAPTTRRVSPLAPGVTSIKIDPYLNIDAGTMSPFEHGEVFTLDDGGEADGSWEQNCGDNGAELPADAARYCPCGDYSPPSAPSPPTSTRSVHGAG